MRTIGLCLLAGALLLVPIRAAAQHPASPSAGPARTVERLSEHSTVDRLLRKGAEIGLTKDQAQSLRAMAQEVKEKNRQVASTYKQRGRPQGPGPRRDGQQMREAVLQIRQNDRAAAERAWALLTREQQARVRHLGL